MGKPHNIPRNYKGENKILFIFSTKSFVLTAGGGFIGILLYYILKIFGFSKIGLIFIILFAGLGFAVGTFKIPENNKFEITRKTGGENIDQVILRWIKFKKKKNKIYIYKENEGVQKNGK